MANTRGSINHPEYDYVCKIVILGDSGVGKSTLLTYHTTEIFKRIYDPTIGVEFDSKIITVDKQRVKVHYWDTSGNPSYHPATYSYFKNTRVFILIFNLTNRASLDNAENIWLPLIKSASNNPNNVKIILVGTQSDYKKYAENIQETAQAFSHKINAPYLEVSALTGKNVEELFIIAARYALLKKNEEMDMKSILKNDLEIYIEKIEKERNPDNTINYKAGFWHHRDSRGLNRRANYLLAMKLVYELEKKDIASTFDEIALKRTQLINEHGISLHPDYIARGINSSDLNNIIKKADEMIISQNNLSPSYIKK